MSLEVWFKEDIRNTLLALNETSSNTHAQMVALCGDSASSESYRAGYGDALRAVAIAFGIAVSRSADDVLPANPGRYAARPIVGRIVRMDRFDREAGG